MASGGAGVLVAEMKAKFVGLLMLVGTPMAFGDLISDLVARAEKGETAAQVELAEIFTRGEAAPKDEAAAVLWLTKAAEAGDAGAQAKLGQRFLTQKDAKKAVEWLTKAAEQGNGEAQMALGGIYLAGKVVLKNSAEAAKWFLKCAEAGNPAAACQVGRMHMTGAGVAKDDVEAYKWARVAAQGKDFAAKKMVFVLEQRMAPGEVVEGQIRFQDLVNGKKAGEVLEPLGPPPEDLPEVVEPE